MIGINCFEYARILLRKQQERERERVQRQRDYKNQFCFFLFC